MTRLPFFLKSKLLHQLKFLFFVCFCYVLIAILNCCLVLLSCVRFVVLLMLLDLKIAALQ